MLSSEFNPFEEYEIDMLFSKLHYSGRLPESIYRLLTFYGYDPAKTITEPRSVKESFEFFRTIDLSTLSLGFIKNLTNTIFEMFNTILSEHVKLMSPTLPIKARLLIEQIQKTCQTCIMGTSILLTQDSSAIHCHQLLTAFVFTHLLLEAGDQLEINTHPFRVVLENAKNIYNTFCRNEFDFEVFATIHLDAYDMIDDQITQGSIISRTLKTQIIKKILLLSSLAF